MKKKTNGRSVVGFTEKIEVVGEKKTRKVIARIDTGATMSSVDKAFANEVGLGEVVKKKLVKSSHGITVRPVKKMRFRIDGRQFNMKFTIADRSHLKYKILIGQNVLKKDFIIDPKH